MSDVIQSRNPVIGKKEQGKQRIIIWWIYISYTGWVKAKNKSLETGEWQTPY